jgi:beta-phosphoglucomutase-like phosphatase (HAD superfamily)
VSDQEYGLIFDVDGVLGDTERLSEQATIKMYRELYDLHVEPEAFRPYIGTGAERYCIGPAEERGVKIDVAEAVERRHVHFVALLESGQDISFPGGNALIELVHGARGWKLAIATSSPGKKSELTLKSARVNTDLFDAWIHGDMVTHKKPDPEIYLKACDAIGLPPARCVVIEDAITGIKSSKAAGCPTIAVTNSFSAEELSEADHIVNSLEAVDLPLLQALVGA